MLRNNGEEEQEGQHFIDSLSYTKQIRVLVQCINSPLGLFDCSLMCTTLNIKRSRSKHVWSDPTSIDAWMDTNTPTALQTAHRHHKHASSWMDIDRHNFFFFDNSTGGESIPTWLIYWLLWLSNSHRFTEHLQIICKLFANCYIALAKTEHHLEPIAASSRGSRADDRHNFGSRIDEGSPNYGGRTSMAMVPLHRRSMWPAGVCCTHARGCRSPFMRSNYYGCVTSVQAQS
jgi:hypothetical protein